MWRLTAVSPRIPSRWNFPVKAYFVNENFLLKVFVSLLNFVFMIYLSCALEETLFHLNDVSRVSMPHLIVGDQEIHKKSPPKLPAVIIIFIHLAGTI